MIEYFVITTADDVAPLLFDLRRAAVDGTHGVSFYSLHDIEQRPHANFKHEVHHQTDYVKYCAVHTQMQLIGC